MKIIKKVASEKEVFKFLNQELIFNSFEGFRSQKRKEIAFYFIDRWSNENIKHLINETFLEDKIYLFYRKWNQNLDEITNHCQFEFDDSFTKTFSIQSDYNYVLNMMQQNNLSELITFINSKPSEQLNQLAIKLIFGVKEQIEQANLLKMLENINSWESIFIAIYQVKRSELKNEEPR